MVKSSLTSPGFTSKALFFKSKHSTVFFIISASFWRSDFTGLPQSGTLLPVLTPLSLGPSCAYGRVVLAPATFLKVKSVSLADPRAVDKENQKILRMFNQDQNSFWGIGYCCNKLGGDILGSFPT